MAFATPISMHRRMLKVLAALFFVFVASNAFSSQTTSARETALRAVFRDDASLDHLIDDSFERENLSILQRYIVKDFYKKIVAHPRLPGVMGSWEGQSSPDIAKQAVVDSVISVINRKILEGFRRLELEEKRQIFEIRKEMIGTKNLRYCQINKDVFNVADLRHYSLTLNPIEFKRLHAIFEKALIAALDKIPKPANPPNVDVGLILFVHGALNEKYMQTIIPPEFRAELRSTKVRTPEQLCRLYEYQFGFPKLLDKLTPEHSDAFYVGLFGV